MTIFFHHKRGHTQRHWTRQDQRSKRASPCQQTSSIWPQLSCTTTSRKKQTPQQAPTASTSTRTRQRKFTKNKTTRLLQRKMQKIPIRRTMKQETIKTREINTSSSYNLQDEYVHASLNGAKLTRLGPTTEVSVTMTKICSWEKDITLGFPIDVSESDSWFHQEDRLTQILSTVDPTVLTAEEASTIAVPPPFIEPNLWIYEWLRYCSTPPAVLTRVDG